MTMTKTGIMKQVLKMKMKMDEVKMEMNMRVKTRTRLRTVTRTREVLKGQNFPLGICLARTLSVKPCL